jgi:hypothetical protein
MGVDDPQICGNRKQEESREIAPLIPAIAIFDVVKGFRRRYLDLSGADLGDQARDDLLVLDNNLYPLPNGPGSLFRIARVSNNPTFPVAAISIYRAMPPNYRLRAGSYFGCTVFTDPKDLTAMRWTEAIEAIADGLGKEIGDQGPEHWDLRRFRPDLDRLGPEPNLSTLPLAFDNRWPRSDKNVFIDARGENLDRFHNRLGDYLHAGKALKRYSNILFSFDDYISNSIVDRGQAITRTLEEVFSHEREEAAISPDAARDDHPYPQQTQTQPAPAYRKPEKSALDDDLLLSRPVRQTRLPPAKAAARSKPADPGFSLPKYGIPMSIAGLIILVIFGIGFDQGWLSLGRTPNLQEPVLVSPNPETPQSESGQPNYGTRELRVDQDQYPFGTGATQPDVVDDEDRRVPGKTDDARDRRVEALEAIREELTEALADPAIVENRAARKLIEGYIKGIDRHLRENPEH